MIRLFDAQSGVHLGKITEDQLAFLSAQLEEEGDDDQDYYLNSTTIDMFEQRGADADLVALLRQALGNREDMDIRWEV